MGKCSECGRLGLFLKVNADGLCESCAKQKERQKNRQLYLEQQERLAREEYNSIPRVEIIRSDEKRKRQTGFPEVKYSNITPKGNFRDFIVFDTETTGLSPSKCRIIEIAAVKFHDMKPVAAFQTYVNPEKEIPKEATEVNHINMDQVANAPTISEVLPAFESFIGSSILVAHNAEFDLKFIFYSGSRIFESKCKYIDTYTQAKRILKSPKMKYDKEFEAWEKDYDSDYDVENYKLDTLCDYYNIRIVDQHSALSDALATGKLFVKLVEEKQD